MYSKYPVYFLQTQDWLEFWSEANLPDHGYLQKSAKINLKIENSNQTLDVTLKSFVYIYPWQLSQHFFYIPKAPILELKINGKFIELSQFLDKYQAFKQEKLKASVLEIFKKLLQQIIIEAKTKNVAFVKIDFDDNFNNFLDICDNTTILELVKQTHLNSVISKKTIQYLQAMVLELSESYISEQFNAGDYSTPALIDFWNKTSLFWKQTNENVRRYTKKSLQQNWMVSTEKINQNFEAFWEVYQFTSGRQGFSTHHKNILTTLFNKPFSRIIVLRDESGQAQCVWMGIVSENTLTYLYGGNTNFSFDKYGQYLAHLAALKMADSEHLKYYDLGRYDSSKSYSKFKENYRGEIRNFLGPVDIVIKPLEYNFINSIIKLTKIFKNR